MMTPATDDPRITTGLTTQLAARRARIAAGERPIGWKVGLGTAAAMAGLGIEAPLVGYLMDTGQAPPGSTVSLDGWTKPVAEPELAIFLERDLPAGSDEASVIAAIAAMAPAIELADLDRAPDDVASILAGNVFHRHVIVGDADPTRRGGAVADLVSVVHRNGAETARMDDVEANTGRIVAIVRHVANTLETHGETVKAGEFVIAGSITPPVFLAPSDGEFAHVVDGLGSVSVRLTHG